MASSFETRCKSSAPQDEDLNSSALQSPVTSPLQRTVRSRKRNRTANWNYEFAVENELLLRQLGHISGNIGKITCKRLTVL